MGAMSHPKIVPEFYCSDFSRSLHFYVEVLGFAVRYGRPEERFAYLDLDGAELMIEQTVDLPRTFLAGAVEYPFGRGVHLQIEVENADELHERVLAAGIPLFLPLEERWYRIDKEESGNRQFVVMDPDGYLLRFWHDLGKRKVKTKEQSQDKVQQEKPGAKL
jgi:catechol 2,3-dioxygenase-like lactoylglutathione lyase family enzyme